MQYSSYTTMKCLQRVCEDTIANYTIDGTVKTYQADTDETGQYIEAPDGTKMRLKGTDILIESPDGSTKTMSIEATRAFCRAVFYLIHEMHEDGTVADLGPTPTGHIKNRCVNITNVDEG